MKNELEMTLSSRRPLTESVAREQITSLSDFGDGLVRPDKAGEFEPIKAPFDPADICSAVRWLAKPQGEFLYRQGSPIHLSGQMWNRALPPTSRFACSPFSNYWTGQFDCRWAARVGIEMVEDFVSEMFRATGSDFGLLTTAADRKAKNKARRVTVTRGLILGRVFQDFIGSIYSAASMQNGLASAVFPGSLQSRSAYQVAECR